VLCSGTRYQRHHRGGWSAVVEPDFDAPEAELDDSESEVCLQFQTLLSFEAFQDEEATSEPEVSENVGTLNSSPSSRRSGALSSRCLLRQLLTGSPAPLQRSLSRSPAAWLLASNAAAWPSETRCRLSLCGFS